MAGSVAIVVPGSGAIVVVSRAEGAPPSEQVIISRSDPMQAYPVQTLALGLVHLQGPSSSHSVHVSNEKK